MSKSKQFENSKNQSSWGGKRDNAGRKKGKENEKTIEKKIVKKRIEQRVMRSYQNLIDAQMNLAEGCQFLFVIETKKYKDEKGKWKKERKKPKIVKDPEIIKAYLAGELDDEKNDYFFMTTQKPDNKALDSLLDRVFGKPTQTVAGDKENPLVVENHNIVDGGLDIAKKYEKELKDKLKQ